MFNRRARTAKRRSLRVESLEKRQLMAGDSFGSLHNAAYPTDVNGDGQVTPVDALNVINYLNRMDSGEGETENLAAGNSIKLVDVDDSGTVTVRDALLVINDLFAEGEVPPSLVESLPAKLDYSLFPKAADVDAVGIKTSEIAADSFAATFNNAFEVGGAENELKASDVQTLLDRASGATRSNDAIIAVVDRNGTILGVRVEADVVADFHDDPKKLAYAIDGAVAKARTAAFFSSGQAPLTSRTIRSLSQSTMTQREIESSPVAEDGRFRGPGFVAPIGVGGKFPPEVDFTPQVDLFAIEHQSRDSQLHAGVDRIKGTPDDFALRTRFNADPEFIPKNAEDFFQTWPEAYGVQTGIDLTAQSRGVATLPGGVPLFKTVLDTQDDPDGVPVTSPVSKSINLVGGIGVFFPGEDGFASFEQGFVHGVGQSEKVRTNASKVLEAEFAAFIAAAGGGLVTPNSNFQRNLGEFNSRLPAAPRFVLPNGRIDLVGITLEIFGPNPTRQHRYPGIDRLIQVGRANFGGTEFVSGTLVPVEPAIDAETPGAKLKDGKPVAERWLVAPHDSKVDEGLTAEIVEQIINQGIAEAAITRAAIRLDIDSNFRPGARTAMVLAVTDSTGELLGLHRMPDATIFSIDVSIAKARNVAYYADPGFIGDTDQRVLQDADRIDFNGDGEFGPVATSLNDFSGDTLPYGTALTNRTIRFIAEPRYPTGQELPSSSAAGLNNVDPLCDQKPEICRLIAPQSILRLPGINPLTGENLVDDAPLDIGVYADPSSSAVLAFDAFNIARNFRDIGDDSVIINGTTIKQPLANQNGIVFFPGSTPLYLDNDAAQLVGGFGVSGDGVDQDDVVTSAGQVGYAPPASIRVDQFIVAGVRLPFQKFNRDPRG